jgi:hypothetical protein
VKAPAHSKKEVLIAELLGEMDALLTRVDAVAPTIDAASARLLQSSQGLTASTDRYRHATQAIVERSQTSAVMHIVRRTNEVAQASLEEQTTAMHSAARALFQNEAAGHLHDLSAVLSAALDKARVPNWHSWLTHATTALVAAAVTAALVLHVLRP